MFKKIGELIELNPYNIQTAASVVPTIPTHVLEEMTKFAASLKRIAPKAEDFLYFSAVMMHAAEAALINEDGTPKMTRKGEPLSASWDISKDGTWKWVCNDQYVKALKNANGDIFPEVQLIQAYKKWVGKPLCIDHKSNSVDHVRGFIVDTYYDRNLKRVVALCALDKKNYPDLARKVETGYSNAVSMGVGVGKAICYDCGQVARVEADFCHHMRTKSGYGEINIDLNPIELSIVVNGADPNAQIKHIIAAADTLNAYVEEKEQELAKAAKRHYNASISYSGDDPADGGSGNITVEVNDLSTLKAAIDKALDDFAKIEQSASPESMPVRDGNNAAYNQSGSSLAMPETDFSGTELSIAPPVARLASTDELRNQMNQKLSSLEAKIAKIQRDFNQLSTSNTNTTNEDTMTGTKEIDKKGYFQGGGGLNEPTPGERRYEIDPLNEEDRNHHDKQMVGQKPFPDVGPVDGMYPGYDSFPTGELERKKMLARAEAEERAIRRNAVISKAKDALENSKKAYFQNGEGPSNPNTPTPHKVKYPIDPLQVEDRNHEDKQMVGQKPFPDVGKVDGLHPSPLSADEKDELKRKELLQRAGLTARFTKSADLAASTWQVFGEDGKLLLSKTVDELTYGNVEGLYDVVRSEAFAKELMSKVRKLGVEKTNALYKKAQVPPPSPMDAPPAPTSAPMPDSGKDEKKTPLELAETIRDLASDLVEAESTLHGEPAEMGDLTPASDSSGSVSTASMQNELSTALSKAIRETVEGLALHEKELRAAARIYEKGLITTANRDFLTSTIDETVVEAKQALADALHLMHAYVKFADTVNKLEKRAETNGETMQPENKEIMGMLGETEAGLHELASVLGYAKVAASSEESSEDSSSANDIEALLADDLDASDSSEDSSSASDSSDESDSSSADDTNDVIMVSDAATAAELSKANPAATIEVKKASKAGRAAIRAKLASEMDKVNPIFYDFHPKGGFTPTGGEDHALKTQDDLAKVETIEEKHDKIMDVVHTQPQVKKQAAEINDLIKSGKLSVDQLDLLVANGVDPAAVKYWKDFYGEMGPEGKEFATELVKEHAKAQLEEEMATYRVKIARAFELAHEMKLAELIPSTRESVSKTVDEIMSWNDQAFESFKKVVASHAPLLRKSAGSMPQVAGSALFSEEAPQVDDFRSQLDAAFSTSKTRMF